jgi:hypothetical protein
VDGEHRAADPTLTALRDDVLVTWWDGDKRPATAHQFNDDGLRHVRTFCGHRSTGSPMGSEDARWFAVPYRDCFPDAPIPGVRRVSRDGRTWETGDPHLAWQLGSRRRRGSQENRS